MWFIIIGVILVLVSSGFGFFVWRSRSLGQSRLNRRSTSMHPPVSSSSATNRPAYASRARPGQITSAPRESLVPSTRADVNVADLQSVIRPLPPTIGAQNPIVISSAPEYRYRNTDPPRPVRVMPELPPRINVRTRRPTIELPLIEPLEPPSENGSFIVKTVRKPGENSPVTAPTIEGAGQIISLPYSIPLYKNPRRCKVCGNSIRESFSTTGWARCQETKKLVHGHCYSVSQEGRSATWCTVCEKECVSGQAMSIEGVIE